MPHQTKLTAVPEADDFSLVAGGPLFQLWRRTNLSGEALQTLPRRIAVMVGLAWIPLLLLSISEGRAWGDSLVLPFLKDMETHLKLVVAVPLLLLAERTVHHRLSRIVRMFRDRGLIPDAAQPRFDAAIASALRLRNSVAAELLLIVFVYVVGILFVWRTQSTLDVSSWYVIGKSDGLQMSRAGWWAACVSMPIVQFLLLRWYFRLFIWGRFLWQVSRIELILRPAHPDGVAGLRFLSARHAYTPLLLAQGVGLAGLIANRIFYEGASLMEFKVELVGTVAVMVFAILGPLLSFMSQLRTARRKGMDEYGTFGQRYATDFDRKWIRGHATGEASLDAGGEDIVSLASLRDCYRVIADMQPVPFGLKNVLDMALATLLPVTPLLLTTFSVEQLLERVLRGLF
jgi:hypothetical protein